MRRLVVLAVLGGLGCGSRPATVAPESMNATVTQFFAAIRANDIARIGSLLGTERRPAGEWMKVEELKMRVAVIQKSLAYDGYRVLEGPLPDPGHDDRRTFRIEL